jgi:hypothetical protein
MDRWRGRRANQRDPNPLDPCIAISARRKNSSKPLFEIGLNQSTVSMLPKNTTLRPFGYLKSFILGIYASGSIHCLPFSL